MAKTKEFDRKLDELFQRRTANLRREVGLKKKGPTLKFTKAKVKKSVAGLCETAREVLIRDVGKAAFATCSSKKRQWHPKRGKGYGVEAKKSAFRDWFDDKVDSSTCVYVFWTGKRCEYVGRTGKGGRRPEHHFQKFWMSGVTRIDVYSIRTRKDLPKAECLAIHLFHPFRNAIKASKPKYCSKCPVCSVERRVKKDLNYLFRLR